MEDELLKPRCYATFWNGCLRGMRIRHRPEEKFCPTCRKAVELQAEQVDLTAMINKSTGTKANGLVNGRPSGGTLTCCRARATGGAAAQKVAGGAAGRGVSGVVVTAVASCVFF